MFSRAGKKYLLIIWAIAEISLAIMLIYTAVLSKMTEVVVICVALIITTAMFLIKNLVTGSIKLFGRSKEKKRWHEYSGWIVSLLLAISAIIYLYQN